MATRACMSKAKIMLLCSAYVTMKNHCSYLSTYGTKQNSWVDLRKVWICAIVSGFLNLRKISYVFMYAKSSFLYHVVWQKNPRLPTHLSTRAAGKPQSSLWIQDGELQIRGLCGWNVSQGHYCPWKGLWTLEPAVQDGMRGPTRPESAGGTQLLQGHKEKVQGEDRRAQKALELYAPSSEVSWRKCAAFDCRQSPAVFGVLCLWRCWWVIRVISQNRLDSRI